MKYKLIIGSPDESKVIDEIIDAATSAGAGKIGNYQRCFAINPIKATWIPNQNANPEDGEVGKVTNADCVWIETECTNENIKPVLKAIKKVHPYEEPGIQIIKLEEIDY